VTVSSSNSDAAGSCLPIGDHMEKRGLVVRGPNLADARSVVVCLLPAGRRAIEDAAPQHVHNVRRHFIDLFTPAELDTLAALNERVLRHLAEEPFPEQSTPDDPELQS